MFNGRYDEAEQAWRKRVKIAERLWDWTDHADGVWRVMADMNVHLGWVLMELGRVDEAYRQFELGLAKRRQNADRNPENIDWLNSLGGGYYHLQWAQQYLGMQQEAYENILISNSFYKRLADADATDQVAVGNYARSLRWVAEAEISQGLHASAIANLEKSLTLFRGLLDFEPRNTMFQYQACVSMVTLAELQWDISDGNGLATTLSTHCPNDASTLSLNHFKVFNRFYGYRLTQLKLDVAIRDGDLGMARRLYQELSDAWSEETPELRESLRGQKVGLVFAVQATKLHALDPSVPPLTSQLAEAIRKFESSAVNSLPSSSDLLKRARFVLDETKETLNNKAR